MQIYRWFYKIHWFYNQIYRTGDRGPRSVTLSNIYIQTPVVTELKHTSINPGLSQNTQIWESENTESITPFEKQSCVIFWEPDTSNFSYEALEETEDVLSNYIWAVTDISRNKAVTFQTWATFLRYRSSDKTDLQSDLQPILHANLQSDLHTDLLADLQYNLQDPHDLQEIYRRYNIGESRQSINSSFCKFSSHLIYLFTRKHNGSSCWNW